jgi:protein-disulfide isomerase
MSKQFLGILAAVVVGLGLIFWIGSSKKSDNKGSSNSSNTQSSQHIIGEGQKKVTLTEYGDFQCPVCGAYYQPVKEVVAKYNKDIYFEFRNLPLAQIHPNAFAASRAAEAAGKQDKYFEMHDILYENQQLWSNTSNPVPIFQSYAQQLSLDLKKFNSDYSSAAVNDAIQADITAFKKTGQQEATPTFFIDGVHIPNSKLSDGNGPSVAKFSEQIDAAIAAKK